MVKTQYTKADPNHMAEVGLVGPDGKEIPVSLVYSQVELATKYWMVLKRNSTSQIDYVI